jgi:hypothetical protein
MAPGGGFAFAAPAAMLPPDGMPPPPPMGIPLGFSVLPDQPRARLPLRAHDLQLNLVKDIRS